MDPANATQACGCSAPCACEPAAALGASRRIAVPFQPNRSDRALPSTDIILCTGHGPHAPATVVDTAVPARKLTRLPAPRSTGWQVSSTQTNPTSGPIARPLEPIPPDPRWQWVGGRDPGSRRRSSGSSAPKVSSESELNDQPYDPDLAERAALAHPTGMDRWLAMYQLRRSAAVLGGTVTYVPDLTPTGAPGAANGSPGAANESTPPPAAPPPANISNISPTTRYRGHLDLTPAHPQPSANASIADDLLWKPPAPCPQPNVFTKMLDLRNTHWLGRPLHSQLCMVHLGISNHPSLPGWSSTRPKVEVKTSVPTTSELPTTNDGLRLLNARFPFYAFLKGQEPSPEYAPITTPSRGPKPGLFFQSDLVCEAVALARDLLWRMPFLWRPESALKSCRTMDDDDHQSVGVAFAQNTLRSKPLRVSWGGSRGLTKLKKPHVIIHENGLVDIIPGPNLSGVAATWRRRYIALSEIYDIDAFIADYYFYWAWRLDSARRRAESFVQSASEDYMRGNHLEVYRASRTAQWFDLLADLCARYAMASVARIAGVLAHEVLHEGTGNHCVRSGNELGCCHNQVLGSVIGGLSGIFGLPAALGNPPTQSHTADWPVRYSVPYPPYGFATVGSDDMACATNSCGPYRHWGFASSMSQQFTYSCPDARDILRPLLQQKLTIPSLYTIGNFRTMQAAQITQRFAELNTAGDDYDVVSTATCGDLRESYWVGVPNGLRREFVAWSQQP